MKKFLPIFFMAFLACASAQSCNNPLLDVYNITGLGAPVSGDGLAYCSNIQNNCCSNTTALALQEKLNSLTNTLQALAGQRDIIIAQLDHNYTSQFRDRVSDLTDLTDEISDIQKANAAVGDPIHTQFLSLRQLGNNLDDISDEDNFKKDFIDMQNKRVVCFTALLQIQAEAYCLACDADWAANGVYANGTINSAEAVCATIQDACAPYTVAMDKFNPLFQAQQSYQRLDNLVNYLKVFNENKSILNATLSGDIPVFTNATERTNSQPEGCNDDTCPWQCTHLFSESFVMNTTVASNGGGVIGGGDVAYPDLGVTQVIATGSSGAGTDDAARLLQGTTTGTWDPELGASGMEFVLVRDPAAVTNLGSDSSASDADIDAHLSGSRTSLTGALVVMLVSALFFMMF